MDWLIRPWARDDAEATRAIYNQAVLESVATWRHQPYTGPQWADFARQHSSGRHTFLVAEVAGEVAGFAATGPFRSPEGYDLTGEDAIYIAPAFQGQGLGRALLEALLAAAGAKGLHMVVGVLDSGNPASLALHAACGFVEGGRFPEAGHKFGRWLEAVFLYRLLDARPAP